jgi:hypothetical protein
MRAVVALIVVFFSAGLGLAQPAPTPAGACTGNQAEIVECLNKLVAQQQTTITTLQTAVQGQVLDNIVIEWKDHAGSCITYMGNNQVQLRDTCVDPNKNNFKIRPFHQ